MTSETHGFIGEQFDLFGGFVDLRGGRQIGNGGDAPGRAFLVGEAGLL
jgi:hypothetical protein